MNSEIHPKELGEAHREHAAGQDDGRSDDIHSNAAASQRACKARPQLQPPNPV